MMESGYLSRPHQRPRYAAGDSAILGPVPAPYAPLSQARQPNSYADAHAGTAPYAVGPARSLFQTPPSRAGSAHGKMAFMHFAVEAADDNPGESPDAPAPSMPACRWLSCVYRGGQLGVAAYDRISNEVG